MDILSHGLWAGAAYKAANKIREKKNKKPFKVWLTAFFGIFPDVFSFGALFAWMAYALIAGALGFSDFPVKLPHPDMEPASGDTIFIFRLTSFFYDFSHSLPVFLAAFFAVFLVFRRPIWEMGGWLIHVLMDIPTHSYQFYPTPFLWPVSGWKFDGFSWGNPWFLAVNYLLLVAVYLLLRKRKKT